MNQAHSLNRRTFLKTAGLTAAGMAAFSPRSYARIMGANERFRIALVGCGVIAKSHIAALAKISDNVEIVALSDVYETRAREFQEEIGKTWRRPDYALDYRTLLDREDIDYMLIATPEHWHAQMALDTLDAGLHLYLEKPLTHTVDEAFAVVDKVKATGRKLQVGVQGMSDDSYAAAHEAIKAGKLGPVVEAQIDYVRYYGELGPWRVGIDPDLPKPVDLDWDRWLGPAPQRPWSAPRYFEWRNYRDYSGGIATDLFVHRLTRILKAVGLGIPTRVVGMGGIYIWDDGRELPDNMEMLAEYPAIEGITPGMTVHVLGTMANRRPNEHLIRGHKATLVFTRTGWDIVDQVSNEVVEQHQKSGAEDQTLHHQNLQAAIRDNAPLNCDPELGLYGTVAVAGAVDSWAEKKMLTWDAHNNRWA